MSDLAFLQSMPLPPPIIPKAIDGGLGYDDLLRHPNEPVLVEIGPWPGFHEGDMAQLLGPDMRILGTGEVPDATAGGVVAVYVPGKSFAALGDGSHDLLARVVDSSGATTDSLPTAIRIKLTKPGGISSLEETPGVGLLGGSDNMAAPQVEPSTIEPQTGSVTVTVPPYDNMSAGDVVVLRWGPANNELLHGPLTDNEVGLPLRFDVPRSTIEAGGSGDQVLLSYQVLDDVLNASPWSQLNRVKVANPYLPDAPLIVEAKYVDGGYVLDVDALAGADPTAMITGLQPGDRIMVYLSGTTSSGSPVDYRSEYIDIAQPFLLLKLPNTHFTQMAMSSGAVWYTRERGGVTLESLRLYLSVLGKPVELNAPRVAEAAGDDLDPDRVSTGATVEIEASPLIRPGMGVEYVMYGTRTNGVIIADQGYRDIGTNTGFPLVFVTPENKIASLIGSTATFSYTVFTYDADSLVHDGSPRRSRSAGGRASMTSPERTYRIRSANQADLPKPTVPDVEDTIDPELIDDRFGVQVNASYPDMQPGDVVTLTWLGSQQVTPYTDTLTYRGFPLAFLVKESAFLTPNIGGTVSMFYTVRRGSDTRLSETAVFNVGSGPRDLPAPTVDQAPTGSLKPADATSGIAVRIPSVVTFQPGDTVGVRLGNYSTATKPGAADLTFDVPAAEIARYLGQSVPVTYTLVRKGQSYTSATMTLKVEAFADQDAQLPKPKITEASSGTLDLGGFEGDPTVTVAPWPLIAQGQTVWLVVRGTVDGSTKTISLIRAKPVTDKQVTNGLRVTIPRAELEALQDGSTITVRCRVAFDGSPSEESAVRFPLRQNTLVNAPTEIYLDFEDVPAQTLPINVPVPFKGGAVTITALSPNIRIQNGGTAWSPASINNMLYLYRTVAAIEVARPVKYVRFGIADSSRIPSSVAIHNIRGEVTQVNTPPFGANGQAWFEHTSTTPIKKIIITEGGGDSYLDHFTFK